MKNMKNSLRNKMSFIRNIFYSMKYEIIYKIRLIIYLLNIKNK